MIYTRKLNDKDRKSPVAVAYDPTHIMLREAGKANYGKEKTLVSVKDGNLYIHEDIAEKFGLKIVIKKKEETE